LQHLAGRPIGAIQSTALRPGLDNHHGNVVRDDVVQLARDPSPFPHHRFPCSDIAFALGEVSPAVTVADDPAYEQHDNGGDDHERGRALHAPAGRRT